MTGEIELTLIGLYCALLFGSMPVIAVVLEDYSKLIYLLQSRRLELLRRSLKTCWLLIELTNWKTKAKTARKREDSGNFVYYTLSDPYPG